MQTIRRLHLFYGVIPKSGEAFTANCGASLVFQGIMPKDQVDRRKICRDCIGKIDGHSVLSPAKGEECIVVIEYQEVECQEVNQFFEA